MARNLAISLGHHGCQEMKRANASSVSAGISQGERGIQPFFC